MTSLSCARSVGDIGDHSLPNLSVVSSPDELSFSCYEIIQTVCVFCALPSSAFDTTQIFPLIFFSSPSALFICPKHFTKSCLFLKVRVIFGIQPFPLLLRLTSFQSMIFSLFFGCTAVLLLQVFFLGVLSIYMT